MTAHMLIECVNTAADRWAPRLFAASLDAAALLAIVGLVWFLIRGRVAPQVGYCLFLLVPLKLLTPVDLTVPAAVALWTPSALASSWLERNRAGESLDSPPTAGTPIAAVASDKPGPSQQTRHARATEAKPVAAPPVAAESNSSLEARSEHSTMKVAAAPRLSATTLALTLWSIVVLLLLVRLVRTELRFRARFRLLATLDPSRLAIDLDQLRRLAGVTQAVRVVECDDITSPAVCGIVRPTIILPRAIAASLTAPQLRWVLLHELAHVRRRDLLVVVFQRLAAILHFFNPAVWIANHFIHRLREYACDDAALSRCGTSAVDSGEAFLTILRHAAGNHRGLDGALGVFGLDSRASLFLRIGRLLDSDRPIRTRLGAWSFCGLALLAAIALPNLRAATEAAGDLSAAGSASATDPATSETIANQVVTEDDLSFELRVVGPDGKPVPAAMIELRTDAPPTPEQILRGKFVRPATFGPFVTADAEGCLVVKFPQMPNGFHLSIIMPGYGPYWAAWSPESNSEPIPRRFTAELDAGWSIGGIVVDGEGKPVAGAQMNPAVIFKKRPGDRQELHVGMDLKTDAAGRWRFDSVPVSKGEVSVAITHPDFMVVRVPLARSQFEIKPGDQPSGKVVLDRGLTVVGKITDEQGAPIAGALVRAKVQNDVRQATTGDDGAYKLIGCQSGRTDIIVSANGRAIDKREVRVETAMDPADFEMQPGGKIRIRVLDDEGRPVRGRIFFQKWRGAFAYVELGLVNQYTDEYGVWEWHEAPVDSFQADICRLDGMQLSGQRLIARDEEYVFRPNAALVVSGRVIDAETRQPIKSFQVVPGDRFHDGQIIWQRSEQFTAADGKYTVRNTLDRFAHLIRIEAGGYQPAVSREIKSDEGDVSVDFELKPGKDIAATVLTPDGRPGVGAKVALGIPGAQTHVANGDFDAQSTDAARVETDDQGHFRFPPQDSTFQVVILHPAGYAHLKPTADEPIPATIELEAWARVEGVLRVGKKPAPNVPISIQTVALQSPGGDVPRIFATYDASTDKDGHFVFERVVAGGARIGRRVWPTFSDGAKEAASSCMVPVVFAAGETSRVELGGTGRRVVATLEQPKAFNGKVDWDFLTIFVRPYVAPPPNRDDLIPAAIRGNADKRAAWLREWKQTPLGQQWKVRQIAYDANLQVSNAGPYFTASLNRDGSFHIDDMPAGDFSITVWLGFDTAKRPWNGSCRFSVPRSEGGASDEPLDLGVLTLQ
ncbi:MAG TPA: carboxypeptidase regulatory-like domain-containing protein [Pirellulales bacterium]|jgi:beta-lactamase regulating signal transducer with metallopeptidase domain/protocatechuate 3,4-dioxygenase beta subunit|nr:carboxypeptidase regulatory-like domain-containing protein [Pirellulales bacterium]